MFNNTIKTEASKQGEKKAVQFTSHKRSWLKKANIRIHSLVEQHNNCHSNGEPQTSGKNNNTTPSQRIGSKMPPWCKDKSKWQRFHSTVHDASNRLCRRQHELTTTSGEQRKILRIVSRLSGGFLFFFFKRQHTEITETYVLQPNVKSATNVAHMTMLHNNIVMCAKIQQNLHFNGQCVDALNIIWSCTRV